MKEGRRLREQYYVGRMSAVGRIDRLYPVVDRMMERDDGSVGQDEAEALAGADVVDAAVHHGVLTATEDGILTFGIPSFGSYMAMRSARHRERLRGRAG